MTPGDEPAPFLYVVRCNFTDPAHAEGWNSFYADEHGPALLGMPGFRSLTRYEAVGLDQSIQHMALWELESPTALESEEYRTYGGGNWPAEWKPYVTDWTRAVFKKTLHLRTGSAD